MKYKIGLSVPKIVCVGLFLNTTVLASSHEQMPEAGKDQAGEVVQQPDQTLEEEQPGEVVQIPVQQLDEDTADEVAQQPGQVGQDRPDEVIQLPVEQVGAGKPEDVAQQPVQQVDTGKPEDVVQEPIGQEGSIWDFLRDSGEFRILTEILEVSGLLEVLEQSGPWTIFAPSDRAFDLIDQQTIDSLKEDQNALRQLLLYHVVAGEIDLTMALQEQATESMNGDVLSFGVDGLDAYVNNSRIVEANIRTSNGIIHIVDQILTPMEVVVPEPVGTIMELGRANPDFSILVELVSLAELDTILAAEGPFTVFAPNNAAFEALGTEALETLKEDMDLLRDILLYHVIVGEEIRSDLAILLNSAEMANGQDIMIQVDLDGLVINNAKVLQADIIATNGVIHVIDTILLP